MAAFAMPLQACSVALILALVWESRMQARLWSSLHSYLLLSAIVLVAWRTIDSIRGQLSLRAYRQPKAHWPQLAAGALRVTVWLLMAAAVHVAMPDEQFRNHAESLTKSWTAAGVLVLLALLPRQRRWAPADALFGALLFGIGLNLSRALDERTKDALDVVSPFERASHVLNAGMSLLVNEHARFSGWTEATDLFPLTPSGRLCQGVGLAAYPCFGAPVLAPVSGEVVHVVNDRPDMPLGELDEEVRTGNSISIWTPDGRFLMLAHLERSSILVREGDRVTVGDPIARCGNSGVASVPHLLLQVRDRPVDLNEGSAPRTFPLRFINALRLRDHSIETEPFVVRRNDVIHPLAVDQHP